MEYKEMPDYALEYRLHDLLNFGFEEIEPLYYCSSWDATMPLIIERNGSVIYNWEIDGEYTCECICTYKHSLGDYPVKLSATDKSPLRAMVICLIIALESKRGVICESIHN